MARTMYLNYATNNIFNKIKNKEQLTQKDIIVIPNSGNGNCFFKIISQFYTNNEKYYYYYRKKIVEYIFTQINIDKIKYLYIYYNNNNIITYMDNLNKLIYTGSYTG